MELSAFVPSLGPDTTADAEASAHRKPRVSPSRHPATRRGKSEREDAPHVLHEYGVRRLILSPSSSGALPRTSLVIHHRMAYPARVAMRWAIRLRSSGLGGGGFGHRAVTAESLYQYNNTIAWVYEWAALAPEGPGNLDLFLTEGGVLSRAQLTSLVDWIDTRGRPWLAGRIEAGHRLTFSEPENIIPKLAVVRSFLTFALDPGMRMGHPVRTEARDKGLEDLEAVLDVRTPDLITKDRKTPGGPLSTEEISHIRSLIACDRGDVPSGVFSPATAFRNWLLFEVAVATGFRVSELAALTLDSIRPTSDKIKMRDLRNSPEGDDRLQAAGSKTFGRDIPVEPDLLRHIDAFVLESRQPWGRKAAPGVRTLWTTTTGRPLSVKRILKVFQEIGIASGIRLTCHRPRHRFVDTVLERMDDADAMTLTGHSSTESLQPYRHEKSRTRADHVRRDASVSAGDRRRRDAAQGVSP